MDRRSRVDAARKRTDKQNNAMHLYFQQLADALNKAGLEMKTVLAAKSVDVPWNKTLVKEVLWRPIQKALTGKRSSLDLDTVEPSEIYAILDRHIGEHFGIHVEWPGEEHARQQQRSSGGFGRSSRV